MDRQAYAIAERLLAEGPIPLIQAGTDGSWRPHRATLYRWAKYGLRGCVLESFLLGGKRMTSRKAFERFVLAASQPREGSLLATN